MRNSKCAQYVWVVMDDSVSEEKVNCAAVARTGGLD